jgi:hypothetical protein
MQHLMLVKSNRYPELLPHGSYLFRHPWSYVQQWVAVFRLNQADNDREKRISRDRAQDDIVRRREYRKAHDIPEVTGPMAWLGLGTVEEDLRIKEKKERAGRERREEDEMRGSFEQHEEEGGQKEGEEVVQKERPRRVFFGIWG